MMDLSLMAMDDLKDDIIKKMENYNDVTLAL